MEIVMNIFVDINRQREQTVLAAKRIYIETPPLLWLA
jgi:hypothetical protein